MAGRRGPASSRHIWHSWTRLQFEGPWLGWVCGRPDYPGVMAGRRGPASSRISPSAGRTARAGRRAWRPGFAGPVPASSSRAAPGWAYVPDSTVAEFISNSANMTTLRSRTALTVAPNSGLVRETWQTSHTRLPSLDLSGRVRTMSKFVDRTISSSSHRTKNTCWSEHPSGYHHRQIS